jgi:hypothetical protein
VDTSKFNSAAVLPHGLKIEHIRQAMSDFVDFLTLINDGLHGAGLPRFESFVMPAGQDESQGVAQAVHAHVNLSAEPASAPAQGLGNLATLFGGAPAAPRCARTTVLSMIRYSRSGSPEQC